MHLVSQTARQVQRRIIRLTSGRRYSSAPRAPIGLNESAGIPPLQAETTAAMAVRPLFRCCFGPRFPPRMTVACRKLALRRGCWRSVCTPPTSELLITRPPMLFALGPVGKERLCTVLECLRLAFCLRHVDQCRSRSENRNSEASVPRVQSVQTLAGPASYTKVRCCL